MSQKLCRSSPSGRQLELDCRSSPQSRSTTAVAVAVVAFKRSAAAAAAAAARRAAAAPPPTSSYYYIVYIVVRPSACWYIFYCNPQKTFIAPTGPRFCVVAKSTPRSVGDYQSIKVYWNHNVVHVTIAFPASCRRVSPRAHCACGQGGLRFSFRCVGVCMCVCVDVRVCVCARASRVSVCVCRVRLGGGGGLSDGVAVVCARWP